MHQEQAPVVNTQPPSNSELSDDELWNQHLEDTKKTADYYKKIANLTGSSFYEGLAKLTRERLEEEQALSSNS